MGVYRKKPITIEARRYFAESKENIINWLYDNHQTYYLHGDSLRIVTLEGEMRAEFGDWIIKGVQGEFYPRKPEIFAETYEQV
jgi:hypothetical protein